MLELNVKMSIIQDTVAGPGTTICTMTTTGGTAPYVYSIFDDVSVRDTYAISGNRVVTTRVINVNEALNFAVHVVDQSDPQDSATSGLMIPIMQAAAQNMFNKTNVIYKITKDINLYGKALTIPANCTLDFQGGKFNDGYIVGNNTKIIAGINQIFNYVQLSGAFVVDNSYPEWFRAASSSSATNYIQAIQFALDAFKHTNIVTDIDLGGGTLTIPTGCTLNFQGGSFINGTVIGDSTKTNLLLSVFDGDFIFGNEYHNYSTDIDHPVIIENMKCIFHNHFILNSYLSFKNCDVEGIDTSIDVTGLYDRDEQEGNGTPTYYTKIAILLDGGSLSNSTITFNNSSTKTFDKAYNITVTLLRSNAVVYNCDFKDFTSSIYGNLTIINIWHDSLSNVNNCTFSNMSSVAVGTIGGSAPGQLSGGSVRAILIGFWTTDSYLGLTNISNCSFSNIRSVDSSGTEVKHDCDGIYVSGTAGGVVGYYRDVFIQGCTFTNVRKRAIKIQAEGVVIEDCQFKYDIANQNTLMDSVIGLMASNLTIRRSTINSLNTSYNIIHLYSGSLVIDNCNVVTLGSLLLNSALTQKVKIDNCNISCKNNLAYHGADLIGTGTNNINVLNSTVDIGKTSLRGQDGNICMYSNCVINTNNFKEAYSFVPSSNTYFEGVTINNSVLNFDISDITANVSLIEFSKKLYFSNNEVNINSNSEASSTGYVFKSSYNVEGMDINIDTVHFTQTHNSSLMVFNGIAANASTLCYIKNIDLSTFNAVQSISCNTGSATTLITFEDIRVDVENNQYLLLYGIKNVLFKNIYSIPNTYSDSGITINYTQPSNIIFENVYLKPSTRSGGQDFLKSIRSIGREGYLLNTVDSVIRRKYVFDNGQEVLLSANNTDISGDTPTLQAADAGVSKYHTTQEKYILWNGTNWLNADGYKSSYKRKGLTSERPTLDSTDVGYQYYDTTLNKYICWNGTAWVNVDGSALA